MNSTAKTKTKIVAVDTHCVTWGMRPPKADDSDHTKEMRGRARILFQILDDEKARIVLPCIAIAELLVPVSKADRSRFLKVLNEKFICASFDVPATELAAELWEHHRSFPKDAQYQDRPLLKSDLLVIASAKAHGASVLYTHDRRCRSIAAQFMDSKDLPKRHPDMFLDMELKGLDPPTAEF